MSHLGCLPAKPGDSRLGARYGEQARGSRERKRPTSQGGRPPLDRSGAAAGALPPETHQGCVRRNPIGFWSPVALSLRQR